MTRLAILSATLVLSGVPANAEVTTASSNQAFAPASADRPDCVHRPNVSHYDVALQLDTATATLEVQTTVTLASDDVRPEQVFVLGDAYALTSAMSEKGVVELQAIDGPLQRIIVRDSPDPQAPVTFTLRYGGPLQASGRPPLNAVSPERIELNLDGGWIPVRSDYRLRFSSCLTVTNVPETMAVVSQGDLYREGSTVRIIRETADFDLVFLAMPGLKTTLEPGFIFYMREPDGALEQNHRRQATQALAFLETWFGPSPDRPVRMAVIDRERGSGYARRGYIVVTRGRPDDEIGRGKFIAHELAHTWSPAADPTSEDFWLAESTAEYIALRYVEQAFGVVARETLLERKRRVAAEAPPILSGGRGGDAALYSKGVVALFDLETRLGRSVMDALMRDFARERPTTTRRFLALLARHADAVTVQAFADGLAT